MLRAAALAITTLTGACGLAYEVVWQRYLATLLGSQGEATAAILGLFLGGLSLGYYAFGRASRRAPARRLLWLYAAVEAGIGLYAWLFPTLFWAVRALSARLPALPEPLAFPVDVLLSALLIGPPTVLMGATVPILTQALARGLDDATRIHAWVYGLNTFGAFAGALAAGFVLVPWLGLGGVLYATGCANLAAGAAFAALAHRARGRPEAPAPAPVAVTPVAWPPYALAAALLGFAMMSLQTVLNRLGALAFGSSHFTFAMVVAVFVLALACGSLLVTPLRRIPGPVIAGAPWTLAVLLIALYPSLEDAPYWIYAIRSVFRTSDAAFLPFHANAFAFLLAVFFLPLALAGASLPLIFHHLRRETGALGDVAGHLYAWNTVGSLLGALLGGYALLFWLDLDHVYRLGIAAVVAAAVILSARVLAPSRLALAGGALAVLAVIGLLPPWSPERLASGLFRRHEVSPLAHAGPDAFFAAPENRANVVFYDDDPTTSVAVLEYPHPRQGVDRAILVNGKSDGLLLEEYLTRALSGLVPALFADRCERAFVVGYGTGVTAGELVALDSTREVVVAEISAGVIDAAPLFDYGNGETSRSPELRLLRTDAYRALERSEARYDVIVSEPSNPWVSGVENLYAREFLEVARGKLAPGGVYAQWIHLYEIDRPTVELVVRTFESVFDHIAAWYTEDVDLLLLGFDRPDHVLDVRRLAERAQRPDFAAGLERAGVTGVAALLAHELVPAGALRGAAGPGAVHTLLHPILGDRAARAFFRNDSAVLPPSLAPPQSVAGRENALLRRYTRELPPEAARRAWLAAITETCSHRDALCAALIAYRRHEQPGSAALGRLVAEQRTTPRLRAALRSDVLDELERFYDGARGGREPVPHSAVRRATELFARTYHHAAPYRRRVLADLWSRCADERGVAQSCEEGRARAEEVLGPLTR